MRTLGLTILAALSCAPILLAQGPAKEPRTAGAAAMSEKSRKYLDFYLEQWEKRMATINTLETKIVLTETEGPTKKVFTGEASIMKPNYAKMLLKDPNAPTDTRSWKHFVANGTYLWEYTYSTKVVRVEELPKDGLQKHIAMSFLFGMKAADIKKRFDVSIDAEDPTKYTDYYLNLTILPKSKEDMQDFKKAELVFWKNTKDEKYRDVWMLPARIWFQQPNGNTITWELKNMTTQKKFMKADFREPSVNTKEWSVEWSRPPAGTVSRSVRPSK